MSIPLEDETSSGVLAVHANFYEFIPEENIDESNPPVLMAHQLEAGCRYYIVISGENGLYRYDMNDIVEVTGFYNRAPKISFVRKGRDMASITGEKIHLNQVQAAVREAEAMASASVRQFRIIPDTCANRYDLLIEFAEVAPNREMAMSFVRSFDQALSRANIEYASKRESERLAAPRLCVMRPQWSDRAIARDLARGKREAQYKWRQLMLEWDEQSSLEIGSIFDFDAQTRESTLNGVNRRVERLPTVWGCGRETRRRNESGY